MNRMTKHWSNWAAVMVLVLIWIGLSMGSKGCPFRDKKKSVSLPVTGSSAPPQVPSDLIATVVSHNQINLTWSDNSDNETGFAIERQTGAEPDIIEPWTPIATALQADTDLYHDMGLLPSTSYSYRVKAFNLGGDRGWSNTASKTTQAAPPPPDAPSNLVATPISDSQIDLAWSDNSDDEEGFKIERSPDGVTYAWIHTTAADVVSYSDTELDPDTLYSYRVCAYDSNGDSAWSTASAKTLPPPAPPNAPFDLAAIGVSDSQIDLTWTDDSDDETGFAIQRSPDGDDATYTGIGIVGADVVSYHDTGLDPETTYWYRVCAFNVVGESGYSNIASAITLSIPVNPPDAPSNLIATAISSSQIDLSWMDNSDDETGFKVERSPNDIDYTQIGTVAADVTAYSDTGLTPDTFYFYRVRAFNDVGDSGYSNVAETFTPDTLPIAPSDLVAATVSFSEINLTWTDNSGNETGFEIEYKTGVSPYILLTKVAAGTVSHSHTGLNPDTWYSYRVRAYNDIGNSGWSNEASATTNDVPPEAPTELIATVISHEQIDLVWTDNSNNETWFEIEVSLDETTWLPVDTVGVDVTAYSCTTGILPETLYYGRVRAVNAAGNSDWSNVVSGTTPPAPTPPDAPSNLIATPMSASQIDLTWADNSDDETGFKIERSPDGTTYAEIHTTAADVFSYSDIGLTPETEYFYRVCAFNAVGDSAWSVVAEATTPAIPLPDAPTNLIATAISSSQIDLTWVDESDNETGFKIERKTTAVGTYAQIGTVATDVVSYSDTGLSPETEYWYRVCAYNATGDGGWSNEAWATTQAGAPPSGAVCYVFGGRDLSIAASTDTIVKFDPAAGAVTATIIARLPTADGVITPTAFATSVWDPDNQCAYFFGGANNTVTAAEPRTDAIVKFDPAAGTATILAAKLPQPNAMSSAVWDSTNKCAYIFGGDIGTTPSSQVNTIVKFDPAAGTATTLATVLPANNALSSAVWDPVNNVAYIFGGQPFDGGGSYQKTIFKFDPAAGTATQLAVTLPMTIIRTAAVWDTVNNCAYVIGGYSYFPKTYHTGIVKFDPAGPTVTADFAQLPIPAFMACACGAAWDPVNNVAYLAGGYDPVAKVWSGGIMKFDPSIPEATFTGANLPSITYMHSTVWAGAAGPAPEPPAAPTNLSAIAISSSQIDLTWTDNSGNETGFKIERSPDGTTYAQIGTVGADATNYSDTGLTPETEYWYRAKAYNAGGDSAWSNVDSATTQAGAPPGDAVFYIFGGLDYGTTPVTVLDTVVKYDPAAGTAEVVANMPCTKSSISAVWDPDNKCAYILHTGAAYDEVEKFDPVAGTVEVIANLPASGGRYRANAVWDPVNKCAYIFGGISVGTGKPTNEILKFDPVTLEVTVLATVLPVASAQGCGAVWDTVNQCAYIFGGFTSVHYTPHPNIFKFDPAAGTAEIVAQLPTKRNKGAAVWDTVNNCAYVLGGHNGAAYLSEIVKFEAPDIVTANFSALPAGGTQAFHSAAWDAVNHCTYTFGGYDTTAKQLDQIAKFDPTIPEATILGTKLPTITYISAACPGQ